MLCHCHMCHYSTYVNWKGWVKKIIVLRRYKIRVTYYLRAHEAKCIFNHLLKQTEEDSPTLSYEFGTRVHEFKISFPQPPGSNFEISIIEKVFNKSIEYISISRIKISAKVKKVWWGGRKFLVIYPVYIDACITGWPDCSGRLATPGGSLFYLMSATPTVFRLITCFPDSIFRHNGHVVLCLIAWWFL